MAGTDTGSTGKANPLDAERLRLKNMGYTDAEVSQILIAKAVGGSREAGAAPSQGVMSNVISSIVAVAGHARALVPSYRQDFLTIFSTAAPLGARIGSMFSLVLKTAVIAILAFAGWQEWKQHIISATATADAEARKRHAEECSARVKALGDIVRLDHISGPNDALMRDCDPAYAVQAQACDARREAMFKDFDRIDSNDANAGQKVTAAIGVYKLECQVTEAQQGALTAKLLAMKSKAESEAKANANGLIEDMNKLAANAKVLQAARSAGDYDEAYKIAAVNAKAVETVESRNGKAGFLTARALADYAWSGLLVRKFSDALAASSRASTLVAGQDYPVKASADNYRAYSLMFLGRWDEAKAEFRRLQSASINGKRGLDQFKQDFAELRKAGVTHPKMAEVEGGIR